MSDTTLNRFLTYGTLAERLAFVPVPPPLPTLYEWYETDTDSTYVYDGAWHLISVSGGTGINELTGDVTAGPGSGSQAATIAANAVTNAKAAQMAAHTIKGNNTASTADALDLTATETTAELDVFVGDSGSGGTKGLVPAPAAGDAAAGKVLSADGTFAIPLVRIATIPLDDADIKNLPTTAIELVPAPGSGFMLIPLSAVMVARLTVGYGAVDAAAYMQITYAAADAAFSYFPNDAAITNGGVGTTALTTFLSAGERVLRFVPYVNVEGLDGWGPIPGNEGLVDLEDKPWMLSTPNGGGAGTFSLGDPANTLVVTVYYLVVPV